MSKDYQFNIPTRLEILNAIDKYARPISLNVLCKSVGVSKKDNALLEAFKKRLKAMERDFMLFRNRKHAYCLPNKMSLIYGIVSARESGYGFLIPKNGDSDFYLSFSEMRKVFDGDQVIGHEIKSSESKRRSAVILDVVKRANQEIIGKIFKENGAIFFKPLNKKIHHTIVVAQKNSLKFEESDIVLLRINTFPDKNKIPVGEVIEVLGKERNSYASELNITLKKFSIRNVWSKEVLNEVEESCKNIEFEYANSDKKRLDLRHLNFITIDGADAKDHDDAVYCEPFKNGGWILYVAIADVSYFVKKNSFLDKEAYLRGNSVYFPDTVIPMLPQVLSEDLCSLKPNVDRLCICCQIYIDESGVMKKYKFTKSIIKSIAKLTYDDAYNALLHDNASYLQGLREPVCAFVLNNLKNLFDLYNKLEIERNKRGAIDLDMPETKIIFDEFKKIKSIEIVNRNFAHKIIEECMLLANVAAAKFLISNDLKALYRIHEKPKEIKLNNLRDFLKVFNLSLKGGKSPKPSDYLELIAGIRKRANSKMMQIHILQSMSKAVYSSINIGHFGLAYKAYTHFTSPIRRYADLLLHIVMSEYLDAKCKKSKTKNAKNSLENNSFENFCDTIEAIGLHVSETERIADDAVRDMSSWLKCEWMLEHIDSIHDGIITYIANFGIFVELDNFYVEGLVHISNLKSDYYHFDEKFNMLVGEKTGAKYKIGDRCLVKIMSIDLNERKIDLKWIKKIK